MNHQSDVSLHWLYTSDWVYNQLYFWIKTKSLHHLTEPIFRIKWDKVFRQMFLKWDFWGHDKRFNVLNDIFIWKSHYIVWIREASITKIALSIHVLLLCLIGNQYMWRVKLIWIDLDASLEKLSRSSINDVYHTVARLHGYKIKTNLPKIPIL